MNATRRGFLESGLGGAAALAMTRPALASNRPGERDSQAARRVMKEDDRVARDGTILLRDLVAKHKREQRELQAKFGQARA